jgi:hypothetical protein
MNKAKNDNIDSIGNSVYQKESQKFYASLRDVHTKIFSFNPQKIEDGS